MTLDTNFTTVENVVPPISQHNMPLDYERQQFFWSRTEKDGDHLVWTGSVTTRGYGKMFIDGRLEYAHRVAWCIALGIDIKAIDGIKIVKTCEVNGCVLKEHLTAKTKKK